MLFFGIQYGTKSQIQISHICSNHTNFDQMSHFPFPPVWLFRPPLFVSPVFTCPSKYIRVHQCPPSPTTTSPQACVGLLYSSVCLCLSASFCSLECHLASPHSGPLPVSEFRMWSPFGLTHGYDHFQLFNLRLCYKTHDPKGTTSEDPCCTHTKWLAGGTSGCYHECIWTDEFAIYSLTQIVFVILWWH